VVGDVTFTTLASESTETAVDLEDDEVVAEEVVVEVVVEVAIEVVESFLRRSFSKEDQSRPTFCVKTFARASSEDK